MSAQTRASYSEGIRCEGAHTQQLNCLSEAHAINKFGKNSFVSSAIGGISSTVLSVVSKSFPQIGQRHKFTVSSALTLSDHSGEISLISQQGQFAECRGDAM
jgi:hypothetical protein